MQTAQLLELYKLEKANLVDPLDDEGSFPSFKDWKAAYVLENQGIFETVTEEEADRRMDQIVDELEVVLETPPAAELSATTTKEIETMNTQTDGATAATETTETTAAATPSKPKRVRKPAAAKPAKKQTKADIARSVFKRLSRGKTLNREKIIAALMSEAKLSKNGAATYYQSLKGKGGKKAA